MKNNQQSKREYCKKHNQHFRLFCGKCYWDEHPDENGIPMTGLAGVPS